MEDEGFVADAVSTERSVSKHSGDELTAAFCSDVWLPGIDGLELSNSFAPQDPKLLS